MNLEKNFDERLKKKDCLVTRELQEENQQKGKKINELELVIQKMKKEKKEIQRSHLQEIRGREKRSLLV